MAVKELSAVLAREYPHYRVVLATDTGGKSYREVDGISACDLLMDDGDYEVVITWPGKVVADQKGENVSGATERTE